MKLIYKKIRQTILDDKAIKIYILIENNISYEDPFDECTCKVLGVYESKQEAEKHYENISNGEDSDCDSDTETKSWYWLIEDVLIRS